MTKVAGYKIVLQFDSKTLVGYKTHSMDMEADMAEATTGASTNQWKEWQPMFKGAEFSVEGLYDTTAGSNKTMDDVLDLLRAGTQFTAKYGGTVAGDVYYSVSAYIKHVHQGADMSNLADFVVDVVADGEPTKGTVE